MSIAVSSAVAASKTEAAYGRGAAAIGCGTSAVGFDHGVGHSLLLLYNAKTSHCENINISMV